eukprot:1723694-Lingulodinium_polyedra.AAC.1
MAVEASAPLAQEIGTQEVVVGNRGAAFETLSQTFVQRLATAQLCRNLPLHPAKAKKKQASGSGEAIDPDVETEKEPSAAD